MLKRFFALLLIFVMAVSAALAEWTDDYFTLPTTVRDAALADEMIVLSTGVFAPALQKTRMEKYGFTQIAAENYGRELGDMRHVCAYTVYTKTLENGRGAVIIVIRGTGMEEWPLNFDVMPSGNYDLNVAENFYLAGKDILDTWGDTFESLNAPLFMVTGHSRGAACANVLGTLLTDKYGEENVWCYTFATPTTVRGEYKQYNNIFNYINTCDIVPYLPLPQWGFERYGTDILMEPDKLTAEQTEAVQNALASYGDKMKWSVIAGGSDTVRSFVDALASLGDVNDLYNTRWSTQHSGKALEGEEGMTAGEFMLSLIDSIGSSAGAVIVKLARYQANHTAFEPIVRQLVSMITSGAIESVGIMHAQNTYRALMEALQP